MTSSKALRLAICSGILLLAVAAFAASSNSGGQASITLLNCSATSCNATNTSWTLSKCDLDNNGNCVANFTSESVPTTVKWRVVATKTGISDKFITVNGMLTIQNTGSANASIGNIVVNLQRSVKYGKNTSWVSAAADIADAQWGDLSTAPYATATSNLPTCAKGNHAVRCADLVAGGTQEDPTVNAAVNGSNANYSVTSQTGTFTETAASGSLSFYNLADNNSVFALNPAIALAPGGTLNLAYEAKFDNTLIGLADGTPIRVEALVSFGNAGARGGSGATATYVDVDGDGSTSDFGDPQVRTVPCRWSSAVPTTLNDNSVVDLSDANPGTATFAGALDTTGDPIFNFGYGLVAFGTPSYGNFQTDIGGTPGDLTSGSGFETLTNSVTRGANVDVYSIGNSPLEALANCATLTEDASVFQDGCSVPVHKQACAWPVFSNPPQQQDNFCTVSQGGWGAKPHGYNYGMLLTNNFGTLYSNGLVVGSKPSNYMRFTSAAAVIAFLPQGKQPAALTSNLDPNPKSSSAGVFGSQVLALKLNVDFSDAGLLAAGFSKSKYSSSTPGGCEDGQTVSQILADANVVLGGGALPASCGTISILNDVVDHLNNSFDDAPSCPSSN